MDALGRITLGVACIGFGLLCLIYQDFVNALQPVPAATPGYTALALASGLLLAAAGVAMAVNFKPGLAAFVVLVMLLAWIIVLHIPRAFSHLFTPNWWTATFETLALAGAAMVLVGQVVRQQRRRDAGSAAPFCARWCTVRAGQLMFGCALPVFGIQHFMYAEYVATLIPAWIAWPLFWAYFTGVGHAAAGMAVVTRVLARTGAALAGIMYGSWVLILHLPRALDNPGQFTLRAELTSLFVALAFCGAAFIVAASLPRKPAGVSVRIDPSVSGSPARH